MKHLLSVWPEVVSELKNARRILLLMDYDGTLTPIVSRPELAVLSDNTRRLLQTLAGQHRLTLGIVSGRELTDLKKKVGVERIIYAGNHGLEIEVNGVIFVNRQAEELRPILQVVHRALTRSLETIKGVWVENKGLSLSVHYRLAEEGRAAEVERIVREATSGIQASGQAKITFGKMVCEVRPAVTWDKGKAVKLLMKKCGKGGRKSGLLPMYFGDDITDEDAFRVVENYKLGISVFVGEENQRSAARYFLKSPAEVALLLGMLQHTIELKHCTEDICSWSGQRKDQSASPEQYR